MTHILELYDPSLYICNFQLKGKDHTVTIDRTEGGVIEGEDGRKAKKPLIYFRGWDKPLVLPKRGMKILIAMYGSDYTKWGGKQVTIYPTVEKCYGEDTEVIRFRKKVNRTATTTGDAQPVERTLPDRAGALTDALFRASSPERLERTWQQNEALRAALAKDAPELLESCGRAYDDRSIALEEYAAEQARAAELGEGAA